MLTRHNISAISNAQDQVSQDVRSMSSIEIAELTGKRHNDVLRDIRHMLSQLEIDAAQFCATQTYGNNNTREVFNLPKDLTMTLVSGYSVIMRHRIITRWQELEVQALTVPVAKPAFPVPQTYAEALRLAADLSEKTEALTRQVEEMQPTVSAYDRLTNAENTMTITDAAKQLKLKPTQLREWLIAHKWIYKLGGAKAWTAYQDRIDSGCMMHKTTTIERDGETSIYSQARVTAKGLATISKQIEKARHTTMIVGATA